MSDVRFLDDLKTDLLAAAAREAREHGAVRAPRPGPGRPPGRGRALRRVAAVTAAVLVLAGGVGWLARHGSGPGTTAASGAGAGRVPGGDFGALGRPNPAPAARGAVPSPGTDLSLGAQPGANGPAGGVNLAGPRIVKTADLSVQVRRGGFAVAYQAAANVAARYGGFVESSSAGGQPPRSGSLTIRVPARRFTEALGALASLGTVQAESVRGVDVTARYVDLQARIRTWRAQETVLLRLMRQATTIGETLTVENTLQRVQLTIEELQGQLRLLASQTANGTISVFLREAGVPATPPHRPSGSTLGRAWHEAAAGFLAVVAAVVVGLGYLVPIGLLAIIGWALIWQVLRRAGRRAEARPV